MFSWLRDNVFRKGSTRAEESSYRDKDTSSTARNRLHFVLVQDRAGLNTDELAQFKREMISVIENYFVIDENGFDISYKRSRETTTLLINSPIIVRRQEAVKGIVGARAKGSKASKGVVAPAT